MVVLIVIAGSPPVATAAALRSVVELCGLLLGELQQRKEGKTEARGRDGCMRDRVVTQMVSKSMAMQF